MRVLIAVDSFKGSLDATAVATAIGEGWRTLRPDDQLDLAPLADGGEGTAAAIATAVTGTERHTLPDVTGPDGAPTTAEWHVLPDGVAVMDLAQMSGLPLMRRLDPMGATTRGLGETIRAAVERGAREVWVGLGGSASTDAGLGALRALGLRVTDATGREVPEGGAGLALIQAVDASELLPVPGGITLLTDVVSPLTGLDGAAAVFAPQKGAGPGQVAELDRGLAHLAVVLGGDPSQPGAGAAGGTAFGFRTLYQARVEPGARWIAELTRLNERIALADVVITGEGAFDHQSLQGKLAGYVLERAATAGRPGLVVAGVVRTDPGVPHVSLTELAGSSELAIADPQYWARQAGATLTRLI